MPHEDRVTTALEEIRDRNEHWITSQRLTEWTVKQEPCGDVRRLLAAVDGALKLAGEWIVTEYPDDVPMATSQGAATAAEVEASVRCGLALRKAISSALLGETAPAGEGQ